MKSIDKGYLWNDCFKSVPLKVQLLNCHVVMYCCTRVCVLCNGSLADWLLDLLWLSIV